MLDILKPLLGLGCGVAHPLKASDISLPNFSYSSSGILIALSSDKTPIVL